MDKKFMESWNQEADFVFNKVFGDINNLQQKKVKVAQQPKIQFSLDSEKILKDLFGDLI